MKIIKGKRIFSNKSADEIKSKLMECRLIGRYENMNIRSDLRDNYNFFISDFNRQRKNFTAKDFDQCVRKGEILIVEDSYVNLLEDLSSFNLDSKAFLKEIDVLAQCIRNESSMSKKDLEQLLLSLDIIEKK